jgi:uncharacterized protein (DUF1330 family)
MKAFVIFYVEEISDPQQLDEYKKAAHPTLAAAGGRVVVAYGQKEVVEGNDLVGVVMVEFPSYDLAQKWYHSAAYTEVKKLRAMASRTHAVIVEARE